MSYAGDVKQQIINKIAEDYGAIFVPIQDPLELLIKEHAETLVENGCNVGSFAYWLWDGVHPTEAMHGFLAELWLNAAKNILDFDFS